MFLFQFFFFWFGASQTVEIMVLWLWLMIPRSPTTNPPMKKDICVGWIIPSLSSFGDNRNNGMSLVLRRSVAKEGKAVEFPPNKNGADSLNELQVINEPHHHSTSLSPFTSLQSPSPSPSPFTSLQYNRISWLVIIFSTFDFWTKSFPRWKSPLY